MTAGWIKMRCNLDTDPRVIAMARTLGTSELHVVGMLWKAWAWADQHDIDGNAVSVTESTLDRFVGTEGFAAALRLGGWLEGVEDALVFPRFSEHNGPGAKKRAETAVRVSKHRSTKTARPPAPAAEPTPAPAPAAEETGNQFTRPIEVDPSEEKTLKAECNYIFKQLGPWQKEATPDQKRYDKELVFKVVVLCDRRVIDSTNIVHDALKMVREKNRTEPVQKPYALFQECCRTIFIQRRMNFNRALKSVIVPDWLFVKSVAPSGS